MLIERKYTKRPPGHEGERKELTRRTGLLTTVAVLYVRTILRSQTSDVTVNTNLCVLLLIGLE